ncbi:type I-E CRISPR-associated protein Cse2/CasB [Actinobaculum suis]|uniref:type I-E CRISPR-associated protein Cse2/CasB n=1 Tax=Actinobaculum suis TaxID=1657 RepID=UPI000808717E|nr:type I-E CRISPR-associated protein Cse2/CasB [Actinobaculum suis]OCA95038.1 type I-E CRISPR-associated protein Cse2/CasB [Actinobaculum suis]OCA95750.1 type I-E CRISPR-associated protein Cse2/CasB [Actinobaculum suis]
MDNARTATPQQLIARILSRRADGTDKTFRQQRANLRRGIDENTETFAIPYVFPFLSGDSSTYGQKVLLRTAALVAEFVEIPQDDRTSDRPPKPFGRWCYEVSVAQARKDGQEFILNPDKPDTVAQRLAYIHTQDFEEAVRSVYRLMQYARGLTPPPSLDYFGLYRMLSRWGNGISERSRKVRSAPLRHYYAGAASYSPKDNSDSTTNTH